MKLVPWSRNPWQALDQIQDEINSLLQYPYSEGRLGQNLLSLPSVDISEDKDNIYLEADLPGLEQKNIKISLNKDFLTISAKKEEEAKTKEKNYHRIERISRNFYRSVELPGRVNPGGIIFQKKIGS